MTEISIVIPVYGCKDCLMELHNQLTEVLKPSFSTYEIILVDDCSKDQAWGLIKDISKNDSCVKGIKLSRNFGQHAAITAGLAASKGKYAVIMDCDLQDSPQEILNFYRKAQEGYEIIYSRRIKKKFSWVRKFFSKMFFKFMTLSDVEGVEFDSSFSNYSLISRKTIDAFLKFSETDRHYFFILRWLGFSSIVMEYEHSQRFCGKSSYTISKLLKFAFEGIVSQTTILLNIIILFGILICFFSLSLAIFYIIRYFFYDVPLGWTSVIVTTLFMTGIIIFSIGVVGLYVGKIFEQVKNRPLYIVDETTNKN